MSVLTIFFLTIWFFVKFWLRVINSKTSVLGNLSSEYCFLEPRPFPFGCFALLALHWWTDLGPFFAFRRLVQAKGSWKRRSLEEWRQTVLKVGKKLKNWKSLNMEIFRENGKFREWKIRKKKKSEIKKKESRVFFWSRFCPRPQLFFRMLINQDYYTIYFSKQNVPQMVRPPFILIMSCLSMNFLSSGICDLVPAMFVGVV